MIFVSMLLHTFRLSYVQAWLHSWQLLFIELPQIIHLHLLCTVDLILGLFSCKLIGVATILRLLVEIIDEVLQSLLLLLSRVNAYKQQMVHKSDETN